MKTTSFTKTSQVTKNTWIAAALSALLSAGLPASAALPPPITYTGQLLSGANPVANGAYDFQFGLYTAASGGTPVGSTLTLASVPVADGVFYTELNFGSVFTGQPLYLQTSYRVHPVSGNPAYTVQTGRKLIATSGDADFAAVSGTTQGLQSKAVSPLVPTTGQVLTFNGSLWTPTTPAAGGGSYTAGAGLKLTGNAFSVANGGVTASMLSLPLALSAGNASPIVSVTNTSSAAGTKALNVYGGTTALYAESPLASGNGIEGVANSGTSAYGVYGLSTDGRGVLGSASTGTGVFGSANTGNGIIGNSNSGFGVWGNSASNTAVNGISNTGFGVDGVSSSNAGVQGTSDTGAGVAGASSNSYGIWGVTGASGTTATLTTTPGAVHGQGGNGAYGELGKVTYDGSFGNYVIQGYGVYGAVDPNSNTTGTDYAGYFDGPVNVSNILTASGVTTSGLSATGFSFINDLTATTLNVTGNKNFKIDHPLDPANKFLYHSCIESNLPENVYNGKVVTDAAGDATVTLPDYFEAINKNPLYQLTVLGQFAEAAVATEVRNNQFTIKTDKPNVTVCWQVTGERNDAYQRAHPYQAEQDKSENERGKYLDPIDFGQPEEMKIGYQPQRGTVRTSTH